MLSLCPLLLPRCCRFRLYHFPCLQQIYLGEESGKREKIVKLRGERYAIYRTYIRQDEMIELYVERQVGVSNVGNG